MRILVCGGRDFNDWSYFRDSLDDLCLKNKWYISGPDENDNWLPNVFIISGAATGADALAIDWAVVNFCGYQEFPPDWDKYKKAAGPIRNQQMIDEGQPDVCVAFPTPNSRGTWDMIRRCRKHNIPVHIYEGDDR